jgi:hypothetical protein
VLPLLRSRGFPSLKSLDPSRHHGVCFLSHLDLLPADLSLPDSGGDTYRPSDRVSTAVPSLSVSSTQWSSNRRACLPFPSLGPEQQRVMGLVIPPFECSRQQWGIRPWFASLLTVGVVMHVTAGNCRWAACAYPSSEVPVSPARATSNAPPPITHASLQPLASQTFRQPHLATSTYCLLLCCHYVVRN